MKKKKPNIKTIIRQIVREEVAMAIQEVITERNIKCIFSEPQFNPKIIETIAKDTGIKTGVLDPLGSIFDANKMQYFKLINDLGNKLKDC